MSEQKDHHYVPVFYLKNWSMNKNLVWSCKRADYTKKFEIKERSVTKICSELYLYNRTSKNVKDVLVLENFWQHLESLSKKVFDKILTSKNLDKHDYEVFIKFLVAFALRDPITIKQIKEKSPEKFAKLLLFYSSRERLLIERDGLTVDQVKDYILKNHGDQIANIGLDTIPKLVDNNYNFETQKIIHGYHYTFRKISAQDSSFLTCDRPFFRLQGLEAKDNIIALPLSNKCSFFASDNFKFIAKLVSATDEDVCKKFNQNIAAQTNRWLIGDSEQILKSHKKYFSVGKKDLDFSKW